MSYYRFLLPALLLFIFSINTENTHDKKFTTAVILAVALMLSGYFFSAGKAFNNATITSKNFLAMMDKEDTWLQGWLNNQNIQSVAAIDIGKLAFNNNFEVLDLGGLTDKTLAKLPGKHMEKSIPITYFLKRNPDAVLIRLSSRPTNSQLKHTDIMSPTESDLALHPLLHQHYQVVFAMGPSYLRTPFYGQLVFIRKDLKAAISSSKDMPLDYSEGIPFISLQASEASFVK